MLNMNFVLTNEMKMLEYEISSVHMPSISIMKNNDLSCYLTRVVKNTKQNFLREMKNTK